MINNEYISQYHSFNFGSNPTRVLRIPVSVDQKASNITMHIQVVALNNINKFITDIGVRISRTEGTNTFTCNAYFMNPTNKKINAKFALIGEEIYLYVKFADNTYTGFINVVESTSKQYIFENIIEEITSETTYEISRKTIYTLPTNVSIDTSYGDASYSNDNHINICVGIHNTQTIESGSPVLSGLSTQFVFTGILYDRQNGTLYPIRRSSSNLTTNADLTAGYYILMVHGSLNDSQIPNI